MVLIVRIIFDAKKSVGAGKGGVVYKTPNLKRGY